MPDLLVEAVELGHLVDTWIEVEVDVVATEEDLVVGDGVAKRAPLQVALVAADARDVAPGAIVTDWARAPGRERRLRDAVEAAVVGVDDPLAEALEQADLVPRAQVP